MRVHKLSYTLAVFFWNTYLLFIMVKEFHNCGNQLLKNNFKNISTGLALTLPTLMLHLQVVVWF